MLVSALTTGNVAGGSLNSKDGLLSVSWRIEVSCGRLVSANRIEVRN
jgi:hypothetical protein